MELDGKRLRQARQRKMLTLRELADLTGVGADTINRLENGHQRPRISTVRKLADALDIPAESLIHWEAEEEGKAAA